MPKTIPPNQKDIETSDQNYYVTVVFQAAWSMKAESVIPFVKMLSPPTQAYKVSCARSLG
jgi:hypothetical protein